MGRRSIADLITDEQIIETAVSGMGPRSLYNRQGSGIAGILRRARLLGVMEYWYESGAKLCNKLRADGKSVREIVEETGWSHTRVWNWVPKGVRAAPPPAPKPKTMRKVQSCAGMARPDDNDVTRFMRMRWGNPS